MTDLPIIRSPRRRRIAFSTTPEGELCILAPQSASDEYLRQIVRENQPLIERLRRRAALNADRRPAAKFVEGEEFWLWGKKYPLRFSRRVIAFDAAFILPAGTPDEVYACLEGFDRNALRRYITPRIKEFAASAGLSFDRLRISGAETRWGSCSTSGTISFSWMLAQCPVELIDYVIWHELTHLEEMNHSARFYAEVTRVFPEYRQQQKWLKEHGETLLAMAENAE